MGPGLITGASDDDPSGIATYTQVGSQFGFGLLWVLLLTFPLMGGIQEICARIGLVTGRGLGGNLRRHLARPWLFASLALLLVANTVNIGADITAMAASLRLLVGGPILIYTVVFGGASALIEVVVPYHRYVGFLKWLCLAVFSYVGIALVVHIPWTAVAHDIVAPGVEWSAAWVMGAVAVLGTTISPYLFFWQAAEEVEEQRIDEEQQPLRIAPEQSKSQLTQMRTDTWFGMTVSVFVAFFVMLTSAVVFHAHGVLTITTTQQAAEALRPVAGRFANLLFGVGIIGTGLLALPVLAGSSAYAIGEAMNWPTGLEKEFALAPGFYGVIALSTLGGVALNLLHFDAIRALVLAAIVNGVASAPLMILIMVLATRPSVMGHFTLPRRLQVLGWCATAVTTGSALALLAVWRR